MNVKHLYKFKAALLVGGVLATALLSCNKELPVAEPIQTPAPTGQSIVSLVNTTAEYSILKAAIARAGTNLTATLSDSTGVFTFFAPNDAAFQLAGIPSAAAISLFSPGFLDTVLRYHFVPGQKLDSANISSNFPNVQLPTGLVLAPPSAALPPGLRMSVFPSKRGNFLWVNNVPVTQPNIQVSNGVVHKVASLLIPPSQFLWERINSDPDMTYFKAAIQRADSGVTDASKLQALLMNPAISTTVFVPTDQAFKQLLTGQITQALMAQGMDAATAQATATALASSPTVFSNPALSSVLTPTTVKGLVVYHILGALDPVEQDQTKKYKPVLDRAFSVNFPTTAADKTTLLNNAFAVHPGVKLQATIGTNGMVTAATVKGLVNSTASNLLINPTPAPNGTSDQHYINGVIHKIDQVLRPQ